MAKIEKIVVEVGKKKVEFSLDEAKEMSKILADMFGEKETTYVPFYPYQREIRTYPYRPYDIWYTSNTNDTITYTSGQLQSGE